MPDFNHAQRVDIDVPGPLQQIVVAIDQAGFVAIFPQGPKSRIVSQEIEKCMTVCRTRRTTEREKLPSPVK